MKGTLADQKKLNPWYTEFHQLWVEHVVEPKIASIRLAEEKAETPEKDRMTNSEEILMSSDVAWVQYAESEAKACNQTLEQVYRRGDTLHI